MDLSTLTTNASESISLASLFINLILAGILSFLLSVYFIRFGKTLSNRSSLGKDFTMIALTTTLIITVVKSSLALSLGLVGALSIVRFRAAIKEPEELSYLFLSIAIGLGLGANQTFPTIIAFVVILLMVHLRSSFLTKTDSQNLYFNFEMNQKPSGDTLKKISEVLVASSSRADLKRFVHTDKLFQATFLLDLEDIHQMSSILSKIQSIEPSAAITFIDQSRYFKG